MSDNNLTVAKVACKPKKVKKSHTIEISNLSNSLKEEHLRATFSGCGHIAIFTIKFKLPMGRVCYIQYQSFDAASTAILLDGQELDGLQLSIHLVDDEILADYAKEEKPKKTKKTKEDEEDNDMSGDVDDALAMVREMAGKRPTNDLTNAAEKIAEFRLQTGGPLPMDMQLLLNNTTSGDLTHDEIERQDKLARTIYVGNLNPMIQNEHLQEFFSVCGKVNLVKIAGNSTNPQGARYGFVEFDDLQFTRAAYNLSGHFLLDRPIKIGPAKNAILNPHPSKVTIVANPVKINHAMAKVRLLQQRIATRYVNDSPVNKDENDERKHSSVHHSSRSRSRNYHRYQYRRNSRRRRSVSRKYSSHRSRSRHFSPPVRKRNEEKHTKTERIESKSKHPKSTVSTSRKRHRREMEAGVEHHKHSKHSSSHHSKKRSKNEKRSKYDSHGKRRETHESSGRRREKRRHEKRRRSKKSQKDNKSKKDRSKHKHRTHHSSKDSKV